MLRLALPAVVLLAACTDVAAITPGTCGNYVLEPGEDCDQPQGCSDTCRIECDPAAATTCTAGIDGTCCPGGFSCGVDGECRAPGGKLASSELVQPFAATDFQVADIDGDRIADVLGVSSGSVLARYGSTTVPLAASELRDSPFANGVPAIGDFTGDGRPDVIIPTASGLFGFETSSGAPEAIAFPSRTDPGVAHFRIASLGKADLIQVDAVMAPDMGVTLEVSRNGVNPQPPCGATQDIGPSSLRGRTLHVFDDAGSGGDRYLVPLALLGPGANQSTLCIHVLASGASAPFGGFIDLKLPGDGETFFADLDQSAATCPDLLVPALIGNKETTLLVAGTGSPGACRLATDPLAPGHVAWSTFVSGFPLAVMHVKTLLGTKLAVVTSAGIFAVDATGRSPMIVAPATRAWRTVAVGDFDHDGFDDLATGAISADAEVILQVPASGTTDVSFRQLRVVTGSALAAVAAGDFDGDGTDDIALATADLGSDRTAQLEIIYGGEHVGLEPAIPGPSVSEYDGFVVTQLDDPALPAIYDHSDDLIVAHGNDDLAGDGELTQVFGASTRELSAPYLFSSNFGSTQAADGHGAATAIGAYGAGGSPGVLALFQNPTPTVGNADTWTQLTWNADDTFSALPDRPFDPPADLTLGSMVATNLHVPGGELLLAFGRDATGAVCSAGYYLADSTPTLKLTTESCSEIAPGVDPMVADTLAVSTLASAFPPADASSDGIVLVRELGVSMRRYALHRWALHVTGGVPTLSDPVDYTAEIGAEGCMDAAPIELGGADQGFGDGPEWIVSCRVAVGGGRYSAQLFVGWSDATGMRRYRDLFDTGADVPVMLGVGDLDGNGLPDLVYFAGPPGFTSAHVRLQCDAHGTCPGGS